MKFTHNLGKYMYIYHRYMRALQWDALQQQSTRPATVLNHSFVHAANSPNSRSCLLRSPSHSSTTFNYTRTHTSTDEFANAPQCIRPAPSSWTVRTCLLWVVLFSLFGAKVSIITAKWLFNWLINYETFIWHFANSQLPLPQHSKSFQSWQFFRLWPFCFCRLPLAACRMLSEPEWLKTLRLTFWFLWQLILSLISLFATAAFDNNKIKTCLPNVTTKSMKEANARHLAALESK